MKTFLFLLTILLPFASAAADWEIIRSPTANGGGYLQLDRATIKVDGSLVTVWTRAVYPEPILIPGSTATKSRIVLAQTDFNCSERTERVRRVVYLTDDGSEMVLAERGPLEKAEVLPDTTRENLLLKVCSIKPKQ